MVILYLKLKVSFKYFKNEIVRETSIRRVLEI